MEQPPYVLVRVHEVALKRGNRRRFMRVLTDNLRRVTAGLGVRSVEADHLVARLTLADDADWPALRDALAKTPGAVKFTSVYRADLDYDEVAALVARVAKARRFSTFRISAHRSDKRFPFTSREMNVSLGALVEHETGARVDLTRPDLNIRVDVFASGAFVWTDEEPGAGGLPVGTGGRVAVLMSGGIDSPVAAWRMIRRGCRATLVHFHSFPLVEGRSREKARELAAALNAYQLDTRLYLTPFADVQRAIILSTPGPLRVVAYRRFMMRIAEAVARREGAQALVTGESLGQVGSQTLANIATVGDAAALPVLRPLAGMDKVEIIDQAQAIGTYETSILPDEDCCSLFVPRSPSTAVNVEEARAVERNLDVEALVAQAVEASELVEYHVGGRTVDA